MPRNNDNENTDQPAESSGDVEVTTDATAAADLSTGQGVGDVKPEDIPQALEASNLPPDVRAELVRNHPVTPGAERNTQTVQEQPMPVVTGTRDGSALNDLPIVYFRSDNEPELTVYHPNGENWVQFHNGRLGTANVEWQAVLDRTPEVTRDDDAEVSQSGGLDIDDDGRVHSLVGADVEPIRLASA